MRRFIAAAALAFLLPSIAAAQGGPNGGDRRERQGDQPQAQAQQRESQDQDRGRGNGDNRDRGRNFDNRDHSRDFTENRDRGRDFDRRDNDRGRDYRGGGDRGRHFNYRGRQFAAVRAPAYRYPRGYSYRAWYRGDLLPRLFIAAPFFVDYDWLGLPPPPPGYRWVRYGPDAVLVNIYNGRVDDVIYNAFY